MRFARIEMLFLVWTLPLFLMAYLYGWRKRRQILERFAGHRTLAALAPAGVAARRRWRAVLVLTAGLLVVIALAGPQYGFQWQEIERRGIDLVIALDCSRSMLATDIQPSRLDRAKRKIYDLLTLLQGDRVGLVAFSGTAFLQCPLTIDYPAFNLFLDVLSPDYLPVGGSDLVAALDTAAEAFDPQSTAEKAIILITDGEHTGDRDPLEAARRMAAADIKVFCIGVGSGDGVPLPDTHGGFTKDGSGQIVLSRLDENMLTRMALATGGGYVRSVAGDIDLETIYVQQIRARMESTTIESGRQRIWADRFQWPLALAIALLVIAGWMPLDKKALTTLLLFLAIPVTPPGAMAGPLQQGYEAYEKGAYDQALQRFIDGQLKDPDNPSILYNIGNAYYKAGNFAAAQEHYAQALTKAPPDLKPKLHYNMGNGAYRQGRLEAAVDHYSAALQLSPDDSQAKENLAFVKKRLQQQQQQNDRNRERQDNPDQPRKETQDTGGQQPQQQPDPDSPKENSPPEYGDSAENPQEPNPLDRDGEQQPSQHAQEAPQNRPPESQSTAAQMLNRLKDQPGRAMMPDYRKRTVDKNW
jgi:Ca-activated chloride channel family protein